MRRTSFWALVWFLASMTVAAASAFCVASVVRGEEAAATVETSTVLLDFYANWCRPCQSMRPVVERLEREGVSVRRVDVDADPELARRFGVEAIPAFIVVERGREVDRVVGVATFEELRSKAVRKEKNAEKKAEKKAERRPAPLSPPQQKPKPQPKPTPAWRYEDAKGHRSTVVRVYCRDKDGHTLSIGSGVLVRHHGKVYVLTARHVVADAKEVIVEPCTKKRYRARVLVIDKYWDCAVLDAGGCPPGVEPAEMEYGDDAVLGESARVESCGYGPDGKLACNSGLFIGYRRSSENPENPPDDWFEFSGHARQGDSGGPVFSERGRVIGILWGTDGRVVVGVQAGRLHKTMNAARSIDRTAFRQTSLERQPTPPDDAAIPIEDLRRADGCDCNGVCPRPEPVPYEPMAPTSREKKEKPPKLPWRADEEELQKAQDARIAQLIELERLRAANAAKESQPQKPAAEPSKEPEKAASKETNPLVSAAVLLLSIVGGFVIYFAVPKS